MGDLPLRCSACAAQPALLSFSLRAILLLPPPADAEKSGKGGAAAAAAAAAAMEQLDLGDVGAGWGDELEVAGGEAGGACDLQDGNVVVHCRLFLEWRLLPAAVSRVRCGLPRMGSPLGVGKSVCAIQRGRLLWPYLGASCCGAGCVSWWGMGAGRPA
jgi:hypothetical protein